jgi:hemolysin III
LTTSEQEHPVKPRLRGVLHQWAAVYVLGAGSMLLALAPTLRSRVAVAIYVVSLATMFAVSALYHRPTWAPRARTWLRRADHAAIFLLIAGTYTPVAALAIGAEEGRQLLIAIWAGAAAGIGVALAWPSAPKWVGAVIAVALGWTVVPYLPELMRALTRWELSLIVAGGLAYTVGAIVYALKRPNPWPATFGYHEVFHALTLVAAALHLGAILGIVRSQAG